MTNPHLRVMVSALLLIVAYAWPAYCCWFVFIFLIPLFAYNRLYFRYGFLWGITFYSIHLYPIAQLLYDRGCGNYRLLLYPLLIAYLALQSGIWFFLMERARKYHAQYAWSVLTICFFVWIQCGVFWIFGVREGYPFAVPIIPLAYYANFLRLLPYSGVYGLMAFLIWAQWLGVQYIQHKKGRYLFCAFLLYSVFFIGFFLPQEKEDEFGWVEKLVYISPRSFNEQQCFHPLDCAQEIAYALQKGALCYTNKQACFILPEAAFPFVVYPFIYELWQQSIDDTIHEVVIGMHSNKRDYVKNILSHFQSCRIIQTYEKTHTTFFTERTPFYLKGCTFFTHLFGGKTDRSHHSYDHTNYNLDIDCISTSNTPPYYSPLIRIFNYPFYSVLCSELFFNDFSSLPFKKVPILLLCNDNWFTTNQIKECMFLYAKIYAICWERPIVYVSHTKGATISQTGRATALPAIA